MIYSQENWILIEKFINNKEHALTTIYTLYFFTQFNLIMA